MTQRPTAGDYIANIQANAPKMIDGIKELAASEIGPSAKHAGVGGGLLGGAGVFALGGLRSLFLAAGFGLSVFYFYVANRGVLASLALGFLTIALILLLLAGLLALFGRSQLGKVKAPTHTIEETKLVLSSLAQAASDGATDAKMGVSDRHGVGRPWIQDEDVVATEARYLADPNKVSDLT